MKLNYRVYKKLTNEPFETQVINEKKVEFHYMNDTPYLIQFAARGRFAIWTSNGQDYRVLIEKTYHESLKEFYEPELNKIWLGFLGRISGISKKINMFFIIPTLILYGAVALLASLYFPDQMFQILIGLVILVVISNVVQGKVVNKKVQEENHNAQNLIRDYVGVEKFDELVIAQEEHYKKYFKFEDEPENQNEELENNDNQKEDKNGK